MSDPSSMTEADLQAAIDLAFPTRAGLKVLAGAIRDCLDELYPDEQAAIETAIAARRQAFATGRVLARQAMSVLGLPPGPIQRGAQRQPIWPSATVGSITHAEQLAVASVARPGAIASVGVDLERASRVGEALHRRLFTPAEISVIDYADPRLPGLLFSAKEAGFKATYPLAGRFIGFKEAEVQVDWQKGEFRFHYLGDFAPNRVMDRAEGYFLFCGHYVLSLVIISALD